MVYGADTYDVPAAQDLSAMTIGRHLSMTQSTSYDTFAFYPYTNQIISDVRQKLNQAKIAVIMGHAGPEVISINKKQDVYLRNSHLASLDLSNIELILFEGCSTADSVDNGYNLPETAVNSGATAAVGFQQPLMDILVESDPGKNSYFYQFNEAVFAQLAAGATIEDACEFASDVGGNFDSYDIYGSLNYTLND